MAASLASEKRDNERARNIFLKLWVTTYGHRHPETRKYVLLRWKNSPPRNASLLFSEHFNFGHEGTVGCLSKSSQDSPQTRGADIKIPSYCTAVKF